MRARRAVSLMTLGMVPLLVVVCASGRGSPNQPSGVDLSGTWILDREASDDLESAIANRSRGGVRRGSGGGGGSARAGGGGRRMISREAVYADLESLGKAPDRFTLEQAEGEVTLRFPDGRNVSLRTTGQRQNVTWLDGADVEVRADWRDRALRIERAAEFVTAVDVYSRNGDGARLSVTTTLSGGMGGDVTVERFYDLESAS